MVVVSPAFTVTVDVCPLEFDTFEMETKLLVFLLVVFVLLSSNPSVLLLLLTEKDSEDFLRLEVP